MNCPPTKRLRGLDQDIATAGDFDDPFGDDEAFTQDDLNEIDILSSQAAVPAPTSGFGSKPGANSADHARGSASTSSAGQNKPLSRAATNQSRENTFGLVGKRGNAGISSREPLSSRQQLQQFADREESYILLEIQHAELKRKLKEVEEGITLKSGEIRVLRDSLKASQQEKEVQKQNHMLLETQRQKEHSDREKELNKKVQSLQSELQFKEAEINEMKNKLHNSDKNKTASPLPRNSPKVSALVHPHHGSSSSNSSASPTGNGFITQETFAAQVVVRTTPGKTRRDDKTASSSRSGDRQEVTRPDPFESVKAVNQQHPGGVLLGFLLQQPLFPSSLGLSHLLSMSVTDTHLLSSASSSGFLLHVDAAASRPASMSPVQILAATGLNLLCQSPNTTHTTTITTAAAAAGNNSVCRSCPGAALLLPLLELHLARLVQVLDSLHSSSAGSDSTGAGSLPAGPAAAVAAAAAGLGRLEETGLAALRILHLLLDHSDEVVEAVLSKDNQSKDIDNKIDSAAAVNLHSQNALLRTVLRLCDVGFSSSGGGGGGGGGVGSHREELLINALKVLCVLVERTPHTHSDRLECVLQGVCACVLADLKLQMVSECVSVLMAMCDHPTLAQQLCSHHDPCVFLKLFHFIRTRPDDQEPHTGLILLDLQVIRLLSRLMTRREENWTMSQNSSCQCDTELVQTVVIVFHRQWLDLRDFQEPTGSTGSAPPPGHGSAPSSPWWRGPAASLLRETVLLLHWMLLHHSSFSDSCRPLLHLYDQVIPAVRDTMRRIPGLSESEELALEEICRLDGDDTDDMDTDTGS